MRVINRIKITKKKQTMKKKLFKTSLLSFAAFCGLVLAFSSCANEDIAQSTTGTDNENDKNLTTFVAGDEAKTRTSMDYTSGDFFWEAGDYIYVKDDDGTWQKSNNAPSAKVASFKFKVPGKFENSTTYKVYYPGRNGSNDQVTIPASQAQETPNSTIHFGTSGDCGTADASKQSNGSFAFALDHQAAILVFQPYTSNTVLRDCYLTKIEVTSDNDITDTYTLNSTTGELSGTGSGKKIILATGGWGSNPNGFPLNTTSASVVANGAYMLIKPGTHTLKIRYWIKDVSTYVEGTVTKTLNAFNYAKNTYYDMTANLNVTNYDGDHYYMWDAQDQYWKGYEWTHNNPLWQPTLRYYLPGATTSTFYPQSKATDPTRWYNDSNPGMYVRNDATTPFFQTLPNVNEMTWYCMKGDPRMDNDEVWTTMGHLYKGGVWLKKKAYISGYDKEHAYDGTDWRTTQNTTSNTTVSNILPSASEISKFFFLPSLGTYGGFQGKLLNCGDWGYYWSSSAYPVNSGSNILAFYFQIDNSSISIGVNQRYAGHRAQAFE